MNGEVQSAWGVAVAMLGGVAVGLERQWSGHASAPAGRFAGIRTFALLGGLGGIAGWLWASGAEVLGAILASGAVALVLIAYWAAGRRDPEATTEVAALIVVAAGILSGAGKAQVAAAMIAITTLLLVEKSRLHSFAEKLSDVTLRAAFRFAAMALVILPLLPEGPYGPFGGIRPRMLWLLVLFFSGLSFGGYLARSLLGEGRGYVLAGLLGGLISSTSVTLTFSRLSREEKEASRALALGVLAACTVLYLRVLAASAVLNPAMALRLVPVLAAPLVVGAALTWIGLKHSNFDAASMEPVANPLEFKSAMQMAVLFQVVLIAVRAAQAYWGGAGLLASGALLGLTDMDALTLSMAEAGGSADVLPVAAQATAVGAISNTSLKLAVAAVLGGGDFRRVAVAGLGLLLVASIVSLAAFR
ncbi:MAG: MgtC/SapB family protein [Bryobacteraceae bacterium]